MNLQATVLFSKISKNAEMLRNSPALLAKKLELLMSRLQKWCRARGIYGTMKHYVQRLL